ncbi:hypothetical protein RYX36_014407 [Vicia faba]
MSEIYNNTIQNNNNKQPQISEMFQKFALAFKTKTFEFCTEEIITDQKVIVIKPDPNPLSSPPKSPSPSPSPSLSPSPKPLAPSITSNYKARMFLSLKRINHHRPKIHRHQTRSKSTLFSSEVTVAFAITITFTITEATGTFDYFQLQSAHVPSVEENVKSADKCLFRIFSDSLNARNFAPTVFTIFRLVLHWRLKWKRIRVS